MCPSPNLRTGKGGRRMELSSQMFHRAAGQKRQPAINKTNLVLIKPGQIVPEVRNTSPMPHCSLTHPPPPQNFYTNIGVLFFNSKTPVKWREMVNCASPAA